MDVEKKLATQLLSPDAEDIAIKEYIRRHKGGEVGGLYNIAFNVTECPHPAVRGQYTATHTIPTYDLEINGFIVGSDGLKNALSDGDKFQVVSDKPTMAASTGGGQDHFNYMLPVTIVGDDKVNLKVRYIIADNLTLAKKME